MTANERVKFKHDRGRCVRAVQHCPKDFSMNVKSSHEPLAALGTGVMLVGCGAAQTPTNAAEQTPVESFVANNSASSISA
jgi:hypothetical protein